MTHAAPWLPLHGPRLLKSVAQRPACTCAMSVPGDLMQPLRFASPPPPPSLGLQLPVSSAPGLKRPVWQPMATRGWWLARCRESL